MVIYHINIYFTFEGFLDIVEKQIVNEIMNNYFIHPVYDPVLGYQSAFFFCSDIG